MIKVIEESESGRNKKFRDTVKNKIMTSPQFVKEIENGNYRKFHIRKINGIKTPVSNPNKKTKDNLG